MAIQSTLWFWANRRISQRVLVCNLWPHDDVCFLLPLLYFYFSGFVDQDYGCSDIKGSLGRHYLAVIRSGCTGVYLPAEATGDGQAVRKSVLVPCASLLTLPGLKVDVAGLTPAGLPSNTPHPQIKSRKRPQAHSTQMSREVWLADQLL